MASKAARSARAARTVKERWKAKAWYKIHAPGMLNFTPVAETVTTEPENLMGRVTRIPLQDITKDYRHKNILVRLQVNQARGYNLYTKFLGHTLTNDYIRLLTRRRHSKVDGIFDLTTGDKVRVRIKPMIITEKRIKTSQQKAIRERTAKALNEYVSVHTLAELFHEINSGELGRNLAKDIRIIYPSKRVEIRKMDVLQAPELMEVPPDPEEEKEEGEESSEEPTEGEEAGDVTEEADTEKPAEDSDASPEPEAVEPAEEPSAEPTEEPSAKPAEEAPAPAAVDETSIQEAEAVVEAEPAPADEDDIQEAELAEEPPESAEPEAEAEAPAKE